MLLTKKKKKKRQAVYNWLIEEVKAEFMEGEGVVHSPVKNRRIDGSGLLFSLLSIYVGRYHLGSVKAEKDLVRLTRNGFEPDICFFKKEKQW